MKTKNIKFLLLIVAVIVVVLSVTACGDAGGAPAEPPGGAADEAAAANGADEIAPPEEIVILTQSYVVDHDLWNTAFWDSPVGRAVTDATGVQVRFEFNDHERFSMLLAAGDLTDMVHFLAAPPNFEEILINNGLVIPLDDLIEQYAPNYLREHPSAVEFSRRFWSQGTDTLYFLPTRTTGPTYVGATEGFGLSIRWDLYSELGYPPINNLNDLLDVLEQMHELEPVTPCGRRTFAVSSFTDWGTYWQFAGLSKIWMGSMYDVPGWFNYLDNTPGQPLRFANGLTDENGVFWQQAEFFFEANQRGLLDPDSFVQTWDMLGEKVSAGSIFLLPFTWLSGTFENDPENLAAGRGYMNLPIPGMGTLTRARGHSWQGLISSSDHRIGITTNNRHPELTLRFLDFLSTPEGARLVHTGIQGEDWDYIDGIPQIMPELLALRDNDREAFSQRQQEQGTGLWNLQRWTSLTPHAIHPDGHFMNLWLEEAVMTRGLTPLQQAYADHFGVQYPSQIIRQMLDRGEMFTIWTENCELAYAAFTPVIPEHLRLVEQRVEGLAQTLLAEAILSSNRAEFDARKADAIEQFHASGINDVFEVYLQAWYDAHEATRGLR